MYQVREASLGEVNALTTLVNAAYKGGEGGWTNAKGIMEGSRTTVEILTKDMEQGAVILVVDGKEGEETIPIGCVAVTKVGEDAEIGMLSVLPRKQSGGLGTALLKGALQLASGKLHAQTASVYIVNTRKELVAWYLRQGFENTGEEFSFHSDSEIPVHPVKMLLYRKKL